MSGERMNRAKAIRVKAIRVKARGRDRGGLGIELPTGRVRARSFKLGL